MINALCYGRLASQWCSSKAPACQCRRHKRRGFDPWVGTITWSWKWQPTPVSLPGKSPRGAWGATVCGIANSQTQLSIQAQGGHSVRGCRFKQGVIGPWEDDFWWDTWSSVSFPVPDPQLQERYWRMPLGVLTGCLGPWILFC